MSATKNTCQNGYPVLTSATDGALPRLRRFAIPVGQPELAHITLRDGSAGFLLAHMVSWWADAIEDVTGGQLDDWGYAVRPVRGQTSGYSNHAGGCAVDVNATQHPRGVPLASTFTQREIDRIHRRLAFYDGCIRWGGDYRNSPTDGMHLELVQPLPAVEHRARQLLDSPRGSQLLRRNPGLRRVIES